MRAYWRKCRTSVLAVLICAASLMISAMLFPITSTGADDESSTLRIGVLSDTPDFNIFNPASDTTWKHTILDWSFESITIIGYDSRVYPLLAESWTFDENTLTVDIYLREGVLFHDGEEMHADDVHFSYLMAREGTTHSYNMIPAFDADSNSIVSEAEINNGVQIISDYHVRMIMATPYGMFFSDTLSLPIMPKHIWENHVDLWNRVDVSWGDDSSATIGTGPFFYSGGVPGEFRILDKNTDYWGPDYVTPDGYGTYAPNVDRLHFTVEPDIDTAISSLSDGELDHIASPIPSDRLPLIDPDPSIDVSYICDPGYFYLAFNEKKEPMNNISFRKAVSHLIDKHQIVNGFMGGLGQEGYAAVSPYFGQWHSPAVTRYQFDPITATEILDNVGYVDQTDDGWRDLPDGSPMEMLIVLTPPVDYDPVRTQTAEMIVNNLTDVGLNAETLAVDFDTLVARLCAFDYQMIVMGWNFVGFTECVSMLFDVYGHASVYNTWAFWSETNSNPFYDSIGGVSTLADDETQAMVDEFALLEDFARTSFDVAEQIASVKEGQEIVADAVPCNVLYYRVSVMATSTTWTNWTCHMGTLLNRFSLSWLVFEGGITPEDTLDPTVAIIAPLEECFVNSSDVEVFYTANGTGSEIISVEMDLDGTGWKGAGVSPITLESLTDGEHTVRIRVTDEGGNSGTAIVNFTVDTVAPSIDITYPTNGLPLNENSVTVTWKATDADVTEYNVDGSSWQAISGTSVIISALAEGDHSVSVRAKDLAGNNATDTVSFMVDTEGPSLSITSPEDGWETENRSVTVTWTCTDMGCGIDRIEVCIDGGAFIPVATASEHTFSDLEMGEHIVEVRAYDKAGNMVETSVALTVVEGGGTSTLLVGGIALAIGALAAAVVATWVFMRGKAEK